MGYKRDHHSGWNIKCNILFKILAIDLGLYLEAVIFQRGRYFPSIAPVHGIQAWHLQTHLNMCTKKSLHLCAMSNIRNNDYLHICKLYKIVLLLLRLYDYKKLYIKVDIVSAFLMIRIGPNLFFCRMPDIQPDYSAYLTG